MIYLNLLRNNPDFTKLWYAQVISLLGDWFDTIVLSTLVSKYSNGSGIAIALFLMSRFLPPLLVSPFAGVLVDRYSRKHILFYSNVARAIIVPFFLLANSAETLWIIYLVTVLQFIASSVFEPGQAAITPSLVKRSDLITANTLGTMTWSVMLALGAVIGGIFASIFGTEITLLADAVTFAIAAFFIHRIQHDPAPTTEAEPSITEESKSFTQGLRYVANSPHILTALFIKFGTFIANLDTVMTIFATQIFIIGTDGQLSLGIMYSCFGIGSIIGPIIANRFNDGSIAQLQKWITIGFIASFVGWFVLGGATGFLIACVGIFLRAIGSSTNWTYSTIIIQRITPDHYLGRVFSLDFAGFQIVTVISLMIHGYFVDLSGKENIYLISFVTGLISIIPAVIWVALLAWSKQKAAPIDFLDEVSFIPAE